MRTVRAAALVRRVLGLVLAVAGIAIVVNSLPGFVWVLIFGCSLIWAGWVMYRMERIY